MFTQNRNVLGVPYTRNAYFKLLILVISFSLTNAVLAIELVSLSDNDLVVNNRSANPDITANGNIVVFDSFASDLVSGDNNAARDVFIRNTLTNSTTLVSINSAANNSGNGESFSPAVSADGRFIAFASDASDLVANDGNTFADIFVRDTQNNTTTLVSINNGATGAGNGNSFTPAITPDGRFVAFQSEATDLIAADANGFTDIFIRDLQNNTTTLVSINNGATGSGNGDSFNAAISDDGRFIAFNSAATDLIAADGNAATDVFRRDTLMNETSLVSFRSDGGGVGNGSSLNPSISSNGRIVAYESVATNIVIGDTNAASDIFVVDMSIGSNEIVSINSGATTGGNGDSFRASISANGQFVAFDSMASDLVSGDSNSLTDIFVRDLVANTTTLASINGALIGNGNSINPSVSDNGASIAFESAATNLATGDNNAVEDIYLATLGASVVSATLPGSRSVQVSQTATVFATLINPSAELATGCSVSPSTTIPATFSYQATDAMNNPVGAADTPIDIAANNGTQNFILSFTPSAAFAPTDVFLDFVCSNLNSASNTVGLNTVLLSADANPIPDVVGLTTVVDLVAPQGNTALFAVGSANVGASGDITASVDNNGLPVNVSICQTDAMGACLATAAPSVTLNYATASTASFAIFVTPTATINNDPANNRMFIRFTDNGGVVRGATSTAVRTQ